MTDFFALLGEPRRPWVDPERLKSKFIELSAAMHPDRVNQKSEWAKQTATARYAELNAACQCLRDPKERLRHLLELERGVAPNDIQTVPPEMADLLMEVGRICRDADAFLARKARTTSPLLRVGLLEDSLQRTDVLNALREKIAARRAALVEQTKLLNADWESTPRRMTPNAVQLPLDRVEGIYRMLGYLDRSAEQVHERIVELSL